MVDLARVPVGRAPGRKGKDTHMNSGMSCAGRAAAVAALALFALAAGRADGAILNLPFVEPYADDTPAGPAPWLVATFDDGGAAGAVRVTVAGHLAPGQYAAKIMFSVDPSIDAGKLEPSGVVMAGPFLAPEIHASRDAFSDGHGNAFDVRVYFDISDPLRRFDGNDTLTFTLTGPPTLTAASFSGDGPFNGGTRPAGATGVGSAGQLKGLDPGGKGTGWVTVPEPASAAVLGFGAITLLLRRRRS